VRRLLLGAGAAILVPALAWGATFLVVKSPNNGKFDNVLFGTDAVSTSHAFAVGRADFTVLPVRRPMIQRWDGTRWRIVSSPQPSGGGELRDVDNLSTTSAWAVGFSNTGGGFLNLAQKWNGSTWTTVTTPNRPNSGQNVLLAVKTFSETDAWAVGYNNVPGTLAFETQAMRWNGVDWQLVPTPNPAPLASQLFAMDGTGPSDIWAVGLTQTDADGVRSPMAMHWDGASWTVFPIPAERDAGLEGVVALAPDNVWAAGWAFELPLLWHVPYVVHWDGASWTRVSVPQGSPQGGRLFDISALSPTQVYAVGHTNATGVPTLVLRYNGSTWTIENSPNPLGVRWLWDASPFGGDDLLFVGSAAKIINQNIAAHRTLIIRGND
jgi:hypothetical protein